MPSTLWKKNAFELASLIRLKEVSSVEVTHSVIERIQRVNPKINALVVPCLEQALQQARNWDAAPRKGARLGGVPFSVKEIIQVAGMPCTMGVEQRRSVIARHTATVVQRLLQAGGILLGLTNLPERSFWSESYNHIYGRTHNPFDLTRTCGGSSGGEAALVAAGGSPLGIGSDIAGSIRIPAFYCGVFGHKASQGLIPATGHYPLEDPMSAGLPGSSNLTHCIGPLARSAADLTLALEIMLGPDGIDRDCRDLPYKPPVADFDWHGRKVFVIPRPLIKMCTAVQAEIAHAAVQAAKALQKQGADVEELPEDLFKQGLELWSLVLTGMQSNLGANVQGGKQAGLTLGSDNQLLHLLSESFKLLGGHSHHTPPALLFGWLERLQRLNPMRLRQAMQETERLRGLIERKLNQRNILLLPPQPTVAPLHDELLSRPFDFGYTAVINLLQLPATAIPLGLNSQGLPLGVQAVASHGQDQLCLQAALTLEQAFGGWTAPLKL